ncbi:hypothetical protein NKR23_g11766 [Pleurostoma richardsiae]|uniref:Uncharacterized protein n=1 Tax=Pleurostoma richardsiae TaxID=41990 RepID=A0AA38VGG0_9PEZI|nr:hypothetical protein NKR23_g11766 [Pleurostoma richardsiae]
MSDWPGFNISSSSNNWPYGGPANAGPEPVQPRRDLGKELAEVKKDIESLSCTVDSLKAKIEQISKLLGITVSTQLNALTEVTNMFIEEGKKAQAEKRS